MLSAKHISMTMAEQRVWDSMARDACWDCDGRLMPRERVCSVRVMTVSSSCASCRVCSEAQGCM